MVLGEPDFFIRRSIVGKEAFGLVTPAVVSGQKKRGRPVGTKIRILEQQRPRRWNRVICVSLIL